MNEGQEGNEAAGARVCFDLIAYTSGTVVLILFISVILGGTAAVSRESQTGIVPERT
jgi:hypothetical protein